MESPSGTTWPFRAVRPALLSPFGPVVNNMVIVKNETNGNRIVNGVEIDNQGGVVAYWIASKVPYDPTNMADNITWQRVQAFGRRTGRPLVLQISHEERPEQYRGVPFLAPVIEELKQISRYTNAELTTAIIKAFFSILLSC